MPTGEEPSALANLPLTDQSLDLLRKHYPGSVFIFQVNQMKVDQLIMASNQHTIVDNSLTVIRQFDPEMAELLFQVSKYNIEQVDKAIEYLSSQLAGYYTKAEADKQNTKRSLVERAKQLIQVVERVGVAAPGLIELLARIQKGLENLPI